MEEKKIRLLVRLLKISLTWKDSKILVEFDQRFLQLLFACLQLLFCWLSQIEIPQKAICQSYQKGLSVGGRVFDVQQKDIMKPAESHFWIQRY